MLFFGRNIRKHLHPFSTSAPVYYKHLWFESFLCSSTISHLHEFSHLSQEKMEVERRQSRKIRGKRSLFRIILGGKGREERNGRTDGGGGKWNGRREEEGKEETAAADGGGWREGKLLLSQAQDNEAPEEKPGSVGGGGRKLKKGRLVGAGTR